MPLAVLIPILITFGLNRALPAVWHHYADTPHPSKTQVQQAKQLFDSGDPEAQKIQALQGMNPVVRLDAEPVILSPVPAK